MTAPTTGGIDVSASEQLDKLADRAKRSEENIAHAREEGQAELKARVQQARESSEKHAAELKSGASGAKAKASKWWTDVQDDWNKHIDKIRKDVDNRKDEHDVKRAEHRAEHREDDAEAAVAYAYAALEEAEYAVLDAILAREEADKLAAAR
jgi:hypothetical protein